MMDKDSDLRSGSDMSIKDEGATFDNSSKETLSALEWFKANTYVVDGVLYWNSGESNARLRSSRLAYRPAGCISVRGYIQVRMYKDKFMAHRIIWALHYGLWPKNGIDHINGIKTDNRIENMREVTQFSNSKNAHKYPRREPWIATGIIRRKSKFYAHAQVDNKSIHIGTFKCHTSAHLARLLFDKKNGFSDRHGTVAATA